MTRNPPANSRAPSRPPRTRPLRVVFVAHSASRGGAHVALFNLVTALDRGAFEPMVFLPADGPARAVFEAAGVRTELAPMVRWLLPPGDPKAFRRFQAGLEARVARFEERLRGRGAGLVVTNTVHTAEAALAAVRLGLPHFWYDMDLFPEPNPAGGPLPLAPWQPLPGFYESLRRLSAGVLVASEAVKSAWAAAGIREGVAVLPHGMPGSAFEEAACAGPGGAGPGGSPGEAASRDKAALYGLPAGAPVALFAGRPGPEKGIFVLARAVAAVLARVPEARFFIAGEALPHIRAEAQALLETAGAAHAVRWLGHREDVMELKRAADLVVVPSLWDPFPITVLETLCAARPVVGTASGGMSEQIVDGVTGRLVPPGNAPALADAIAELLLAAPEARERMGRAGFERARSLYGAGRVAGIFEAAAAGFLESWRPDPATAAWAADFLAAAAGVRAPRDPVLASALRSVKAGLRRGLPGLAGWFDALRARRRGKG